MSLLVSSGELKIRSSRFGSIFGTLTGACILIACVWSLVAVSAANAASATPVAAEKGMAMVSRLVGVENQVVSSRQSLAGMCYWRLFYDQRPLVDPDAFDRRRLFGAPRV